MTKKKKSSKKRNAFSIPAKKRKAGIIKPKKVKRKKTKDILEEELNG